MAKETKDKKRGKDTKTRKNGKGFVSIPETDIDFWETLLNRIEEELYVYVNSDKVQAYLANPTAGHPPAIDPKGLVERGLEYFRFTLGHRKAVSVGLLSRFLFGTNGNYKTLLRMEQQDSGLPYKNDIYRPIVETFKDLIVAFHEINGDLKINPGMDIFILKSMRGGFEEKIELENTGVPGGLTEEERVALRDKVKSFTEKPKDKADTYEGL